MMPKIDGLQACMKIREFSNVPIIMLTAKGELEDKVNGLELGADDYITKPFEMKEVLARVHAVLRRYGEEEQKEKKLVFDKLVINLDSYELLVDGKRVDTPPKELELLYHLASSPNRVFTRNQLLDEVWGFDYFGDSRTVDVHVKRLRENGYITMDKDGLITLTERGMSIAASMLDRHHTLTRFLMALGVDQETAEADACKMEHDISQTSFEAICRHARSHL